jgi:hypothetical protein
VIATVNSILIVLEILLGGLVNRKRSNLGPAAAPLSRTTPRVSDKLQFVAALRQAKAYRTFNPDRAFISNLVTFNTDALHTTTTWI